MGQNIGSLISVIVPVYNSAGNMKRCLDSLSSQKYRNLEILFIDDCSTDGSLSILEMFSKDPANSDFSIRIIHHEQNKGVAAARNTGLDNATGQYIYYLDSDDYIENNTLKILYETAERYKADIVACEWYLSFLTNERHMVQPDAGTGEELFRKMCRGVMRWNLWLYLVRRHLYESGRFRFIDGMNMGEDMMVMMKLALSARLVKVLHTPLYHYVQTKSDALTKSWSKGYQNQISENVREVENHINAEHAYKSLLKEIDFLKLNIKLPLLISLSHDDYEKWKSWFPEANGSIKENKDLPLRTRWIQMAASKGMFRMVWLYNMVVIKFVYGFLYR